MEDKNIKKCISSSEKPYFYDKNTKKSFWKLEKSKKIKKFSTYKKLKFQKKEYELFDKFCSSNLKKDFTNNYLESLNFYNAFTDKKEDFLKIYKNNLKKKIEHENLNLLKNEITKLNLLKINKNKLKEICKEKLKLKNLEFKIIYQNLLISKFLNEQKKIFEKEIKFESIKFIDNFDYFVSCFFKKILVFKNNEFFFVENKFFYFENFDELKKIIFEYLNKKLEFRKIIDILIEMKIGKIESVILFYFCMIKYFLK